MEKQENGYGAERLGSVPLSDFRKTGENATTLSVGSRFGHPKLRGCKRPREKIYARLGNLQRMRRWIRVCADVAVEPPP